MGKYEDLTGRKFSNLTVLSLHHKKQLYKKDGKPNGHLYYYECICVCGKKSIVAASALKNSSVKSCGCLQRKRVSEMAKISSRKHGYRNTRLYREWQSMKGRCYYSSVNGYERYGGRGISVCDEWRDNFISFKDWAMAHGYNDELTIDRINVNGNYEPNNCRWVTQKVQSRNSRTNHLITYNNETHCLVEWAEVLGMPYTVIKNRITRLKWDVKRAFTEPVHQEKVRY